MNLIVTLVIILTVVLLIDKIYGKVKLENYSPRWEYFFKAMLYGFITVITLLYGKDSFKEVTLLEWAIIAVSFIEATGNYVNYVKEMKQRKAT